MHVPETNQETFAYLYAIEVGLRELFVDVFENEGRSLWKQRLPNDLLNKMRDARIDQRSTRWYRTVPHHPVYYLDFADLRKVIERSDNWGETV